MNPQHGEVTESNYELREASINIPQDGEILVRALYISVDPYMRIQQSSLHTWEEPHPVGQVQGAGVVAEVIESQAPESGIKVGDIVNCYTGWQLYAVCKASNARKLDFSKFGNAVPISYGLGVLGMPGRTAYFGFMEAGRPKSGETVVVSGAAGAVGCIVVQVAKIKGCRVVATCGSKEKEEYLKSVGADVVLNYKDWKNAEDARSALQQACPNGIDIYFDNVGGITTDAVFHLINLRARIVICGQISQYNGGLDVPELAPRFLHKILYTRATIQGVLARDYSNRMPEMLEEMGKWIQEGKMKYRETIVEGFENLPKALNGLFHGNNTGKMIVKI